MKVNTVLQPDHRAMTRQTLLVAFGLSALAAPLATFARQAAKIPQSILVRADKVIE